MTPASIAHYKITGKLGEGGMGAVYRATDTKLNRDVAIKVLPPAFAEDAARMARFEREAQVLASLNHPNIAAIYGIEQCAIVMELVPGEDLKGPVPLETAVNYARQIAAGLEAAHEKGIVHRDLKPANIKVTADGIVKLLDFGLAKAAGETVSADSASPTMSPTMSLAMTRAGMILGTAAYMSPEQARGKPVDKRADIWAFGVVMYELLTGRMLFGGGETVSDSLAAVLTKEPDWNVLPKDTPAHIRCLLERCLRKDPKLRLRDIGDARLAIDEPEPAPPADESSRGAKRAWLPWMVGLALAVAVALAFALFHEKPPVTPVLRYTVAAPENSHVHSFAISPDGRSVVIAAAAGGKRQLWLRALDALQAQPAPFTEDATYPFWSPDSGTIAFFAQGKLKRVAASGGPSRSLCDAPNARGGSWGRDDVIVFSPNAAGTPIQRVPAAGGVPVDVTKANGSTNKHPVFLPDGLRFLYLTREATSGKSGIYVSSLDGTEKPADSGGCVERGFRASSQGQPHRPHSVRPRKHLDGPALRCAERAACGRCLSGRRQGFSNDEHYLCAGLCLGQRRAALLERRRRFLPDRLV
jgi:serine/threonine-protein kinase